MPGIYQVEDDEQGKEQHDYAKGKGGISGKPGYTLGSLHYGLSSGLKSQAQGILEGEVPAPGIHSEVYDIYDILDDLTEGQGNYGEIVSSQPQHRYAYKESEYA